MKKSTTKSTANATPTTGTPPKTVIGLETRYHGTEHAYLRTSRVKICAVIKGAAKRWEDLESGTDDLAYITDDETLAAAGGVTADDKVEVQPWIDQGTSGVGGCEGSHWSFVCSDARAVDLACFAGLAPAAPTTGTRL